MQLILSSTSTPFRFAVSHLGQRIFEGESTESSVRKDLSLAFPAEGVDLLLEISWADEKPAAARLDLLVNEHAPMTATLWGAKEASDVLTFIPR